MDLRTLGVENFLGSAGNFLTGGTLSSQTTSTTPLTLSAVETPSFLEHMPCYLLEGDIAAMAPRSPGLQGRPAHKPQMQTLPSRLHRFEPFSKRVARLKIDPVHRVDRVEQHGEDGALSGSNFHSSLEYWADLNLSKNYTDFHRKVQPLSENLPQVIYHKDAISDLLFESIDKRDVLSLEPLLSLLAHFAHDLGAGFEQYFQRAVSLVADVAALSDAADVIEWCFTCLAWIFKFLSRLLVPDLRPLLAIMTPHLRSRKPHIVRFTAESLAFLVRKAAANYTRDQSPLDNVETFLLSQSEEMGSDAIKVGAMTLLAEAGMGLENQLHTNAVHLMSCVCDILKRRDSLPETQLQLLNGVMTRLLHHVDSQGAVPVVKWLQEAIDMVDDASPSQTQVRICIRLLSSVVAVRKGSRVLDWASLFRSILKLLPHKSLISIDDNDSWSCFLSIPALALQYAPVNVAVLQAPSILSCVESVLTTQEFYQFCELSAVTGYQGYRDLILPKLRLFIGSKWHNYEPDTCVLIQHLQQTATVQILDTQNEASILPGGWTNRTVEKLVSCLTDPQPAFDPLADGYLHSLLATSTRKGVPLGTPLMEAIRDNLRANTKLTHQSLIPEWSLLAFGRALNLLALSISEESTLDQQLWEIIATVSPKLFRLELFLDSIYKVWSCQPPAQMIDKKADFFLLNHLVENLETSSNNLKSLSVRILGLVFGGEDPSVRNATETLFEVFQTPYSMEHERRISMLLRRLPQIQRQLNEPFKKIVPLACMGLLPTYFDELRNHVCSILSEMAQNPYEEILIFETILKWLQQPGEAPALPSESGEGNLNQRLTQYQCSNVVAVQKSLDAICADYANPESSLERIFRQDHSPVSTQSPALGRELALRVLQSMPEISEKRSRLLVPIFLTAWTPTLKDDGDSVESGESRTSRTLSPSLSEAGWSYPDRRLFLELFTKFKNPRVLYRAADTHVVLMELLKNGSVAIQRLALKATSTWKGTVIKEYEDDLVGLLDETSYSANLDKLIDVFVDTGTDQGEGRELLLNLTLRLLYGQMIGRPGTFNTQEAKRKATLRSLLRLKEQDFGKFLAICLDGMHDNEDLQVDKSMADSRRHKQIPLSRQHGMLRMIHSALQIAQDRFGPFVDSVAPTVVQCTAFASRSAYKAVNVEKTSHSGESGGLARSVRKIGLQCLEMLFRYSSKMNWRPLMQLLFQDVISPRIDDLATETAQGISWLLRLFAVWCEAPETITFFVDFDQTVLSSVWRCLSEVTAKDEVKDFVLKNIVNPLANSGGGEQTISAGASEVLEKEMPNLLENITSLLESGPSRNLLETTIQSLSALAPLTKTSSCVLKLVRLLVDLLRGPLRKGNPREKSQVFRCLLGLTTTNLPSLDEATRSDVWMSVSLALNFFKDTPNRDICCKILQVLAVDSDHLRDSAEFCCKLNTTASSRSLESDYNNQSLAIQRCLENFPGTYAMTKTAFAPVVFNLIYLSRTTEDYALRATAVSGVRTTLVHSLNSHQTDLLAFIKSDIMPAIAANFKEAEEQVRADFVSLLGSVVQHAPSDFGLEDLNVLLVNNDEEASFFTNVLHIQHHRRVRALRRLEAFLEQGLIHAEHVSIFVLPLLEAFIADRGVDTENSSVRGQAIASLATVLKWIKWSRFKILFRKFKSGLDSKAGFEKTTVKLLSTAVDALSAAANSTPMHEASTPPSYLASSLPPSVQLSNEISAHFLPGITDFLHLKDEGELSLRLPAAMVAIKLTRFLSESQAAEKRPAILLDVSQVLRSRSQPSRDAARRSLTEILSILGPSNMPVLLKELKTSLTRGYQRHVLSFTVHSIVAENVSKWSYGALDVSVDMLVEIAVDDVFGTVGEEKESQDYISSLREVKGKKSYDLMEILAKLCSVQSWFKILRPLQSLLDGHLRPKQTQYFDEMLRRVGMGMSRNEYAGSRDVLILAYQLIQDYYIRSGAVSRPATDKQSSEARRHLVQPKAVQKASVASASQSFKIVRFALDLTRTTFQKHKELLSAENVHDFLPIIGDALLKGEDNVKTSALRLLSVIVKLSMPELDQSSELYIRESVNVVRGSISTNSEACQAALKLLAAILRERKSAIVRDSDLAYVLHRITPDLEEPDRQGVTFNFIKAVMARRVMLPEIYEVLDRISMIMVTSHSKGARDAARGVYVHFLLSYPQSKSRWTKQLKYLLKNLEYKHPEGRQSVMEAINTLLVKLHGEYADELLTSSSIPVLLRLANDDNASCREMAGALLAQIFRRGDGAQGATFLELLQSWIEQKENSALRKVAFQAFEVYFEVSGGSQEGQQLDFCQTIRTIIRTVNNAEEPRDSDVLHQTLRLCNTLARKYPTTFLSSHNSSLWGELLKLHWHPSLEVQTELARLFHAWFYDVAQRHDRTDSSAPKLMGVHGLQLPDSAIEEVLRPSFRSAKRLDKTPELEHLTIQNLTFIGKMANALSMTVKISKKSSRTSNGADIDSGNEEEDTSLAESEDDDTKPREIPMAEYLLYQAAHIIRREPAKHTTASLGPRQSMLFLLTTLIPQTSTDHLATILPSLLPTLLHLTNPQTIAPRSPDPTFRPAYTELVTSAQTVLEDLQARMGDKEYVRFLTNASRGIRERRQGRRAKRVVENVAEPEVAARRKKRKVEKKKERSRELSGMFRSRRKGLALP